VLSIDDAEADTLSGQVAFLTAANLLARWCRDARFVAPPAQLHPRARMLVADNLLLGEGAERIAAAADPHGDFRLGASHRSGDHYLHVGRRGAAGVYPILGRGRVALGGGAAKEAVARDGGMVLGAVLAACVGTAQLFRAALGHPHFPSSVRLSLWNLRGAAAAEDGPDVANRELGLVYLIGCGAVGSAIAYLMSLARLLARIRLVDGDEVDDSSLNRSPLFTWLDVGRPKVEVTASYLRRSGLEAHAHEEWFDTAVREGHLFRDRPDLVIPTANDHDVRYAIQDQAPPLQIYGTTSRNWDAFLGRHIPLREDCLACRFPRARIEGEPPLACSTVSVSPPPRAKIQTMDAALPFLSTAAGLLAVAELVKATLEGYPANPNFACLDFRGDLSDIVLDQRQPTSSCRCVSQRRIWPALNSQSSFASLSGTAAKSPDESESSQAGGTRHRRIVAEPKENARRPVLYELGLEPPGAPKAETVAPADLNGR